MVFCPLVYICHIMLCIAEEDLHWVANLQTQAMFKVIFHSKILKLFCLWAKMNPICDKFFKNYICINFLNVFPRVCFFVGCVNHCGNLRSLLK